MGRHDTTEISMARCPLVLCLVLAASAVRAEGPKQVTMKVKVPPMPPLTTDLLAAQLAQAAWASLTGPGWPKGAEQALIGEEPATGGRTIYLRLPAGARVPAHTHSHFQSQIGILGTGTMHLDGKAHPIAPGTFFEIPAKLVHDLSCDGKGPCVFILRVEGPPDVQWVGSGK
jgi:quercetin dioxygenase-like cupin family protein